jgi:molybdenum cofactor synthesis domain-containing protein
MSTAGVLIIGNEILSGKVVDTNSPFLAAELRTLGVDLDRILTIADEVDLIATEVRAMSDAYDHVFTSGGIGPTHDDLTMEGVARAFGREVILHEGICARIRRAQNGKPLNRSQRKMAQIPAGAHMIDAGDLWFPVIIVENVYVFPGIPKLLQKKFRAIRERFSGVPFKLVRVYVKPFESDIANKLDDLLGEFSDLMLGSYPRLGESEYRVMLTLESRDGDYLQRALDSLLSRLSPDDIHKVE